MVSRSARDRLPEPSQRPPRQRIIGGAWRASRSRVEARAVRRRSAHPQPNPGLGFNGSPWPGLYVFAKADLPRAKTPFFRAVDSSRCRTRRRRRPLVAAGPAVVSKARTASRLTVREAARSVSARDVRGLAPYCGWGRTGIAVMTPPPSQEARQVHESSMNSTGAKRQSPRRANYSDCAAQQQTTEGPKRDARGRMFQRKSASAGERGVLPNRVTPFGTRRSRNVVTNLHARFKLDGQAHGPQTPREIDVFPSGEVSTVPTSDAVENMPFDEETGAGRVCAWCSLCGRHLWKR